MTTVTTAAIDADNVSKEGIDLANMDTDASDGISQIILRSAEQVFFSPAITYNANTLATPQNPVALNGSITTFDGAGTISLVAGDILRVYWSMNATVTWTNMVGLNRELFWATWLQWDIGAGYVKVPGQGNFVDDIAGQKTII